MHKIKIKSNNSTFLETSDLPSLLIDVKHNFKLTNNSINDMQICF